MPKVKGPKDGQIISASFDGKSKSTFSSLKTTKDLVLLSIVGNDYCAGEYLGAIVQQAVATHQSKSGDVGAPGKATFLVADEIYWHNLKGIEFSDDELENLKVQAERENEPVEKLMLRLFKEKEDVVALKQRALKKGDDYITENLKYFLAPLGFTVDSFNTTYPDTTVDQRIEIINCLALEQGKNFEIMRWNTWVSQNDGQNQIDKIMPYYESIPALKVAIDQTVTEFVKRKSKEPVAGIVKPHIKAQQEFLWDYRSRGYVTEESPAIMRLAASLGYNFVTYPGEILPSLKATKEFFVAKNHVPYISEGQSVVDKCPHNEHCLHVENPSRLINWLEVNFQRSHASKNLKVSSKDAGFFSTTKTKIESVQGDEVAMTPSVIELDISSPKSPLEVTPRSGSDLMEVMVLKGRRDEHPVVGAGSGSSSSSGREREILLASIVEGVTNALASEFRSPRDNSGKQSLALKRKTIEPANNTLSQAFEGITRGVLGADISNQAKLEFLLDFTDNFLSQKVHPNVMAFG